METSLPNLVVIGAMKCATTALHAQLAAQPDVWMSEPKETNFFIGPEEPPHDDPGSWWREGQWHRGVDWYRSLFDGRFPVRGEASPGYTSPDHPEVPARMHAVVPDAALVYLVRDPADRALSQYEHHRRDGDEQRPVEEALLDPGSQYLARSRYHERLLPFLDHFDRDQVLVVVQERLRDHPAQEMARVRSHAGLAPGDVTAAAAPDARPPDAPARDPGRAELRRHVRDAVADDVDRLRDLVGDPIQEWET